MMAHVLKIMTMEQDIHATAKKDGLEGIVKRRQLLVQLNPAKMVAFVTTLRAVSNVNVVLEMVEEIVSSKCRNAFQTLVSMENASILATVSINVNVIKASRAKTARKTSTIVQVILAKMEANATTALISSHANAWISILGQHVKKRLTFVSKSRVPTEEVAGASIIQLNVFVEMDSLEAIAASKWTSVN